MTDLTISEKLAAFGLSHLPASRAGDYGRRRVIMGETHLATLDAFQASMLADMVAAGADPHSAARAAERVLMAGGKTYPDNPEHGRVARARDAQARAALRQLYRAVTACDASMANAIDPAAMDRARAILEAIDTTGEMPPVPACVRPFLDLSTGHLRPETREAWTAGTAVDDEAMSLVSATQHGFFVWAGDASEGAEADEGWPQDVAACRRRARAMGCDYLLFDADAEPVAGLPFYDDDGTPSEATTIEATSGNGEVAA